jgi:hypothetical protein
MTRWLIPFVAALTALEMACVVLALFGRHAIAEDFVGRRR